METEKIALLFKSFEDAKMSMDGVECWSARDLMLLLGYSSWQNFTKVIGKAKQATQSFDIAESDHFIDIIKMIETGKTALNAPGRGKRTPPSISTDNLLLAWARTLVL